MKKYIFLLLLCLLFCSYCILIGNENNKQNKHSSLSIFKKGWIVSPASGIFDMQLAAPLHIGGDSILSITEGRLFVTTFPLIFNINNSFNIPEDKLGKEIRILINNKCKNLETSILRISFFDREENLTDSIIWDINTSEWELKNICFTPSRNIQLFNIEIEAIGDTVNVKDQGLWLDNISVTIDDIEITSKIELSGDIKETNIDNQFIIPIQKTETDPYKTLIPILDKKVLSLSETIHGSATLAKCAFDIIKEQIRYNNCRLVIQELSIDEALYLNLYIQGKLPESTIHKLKDRTRLLSGTTAIEETVDFLKWLRQYNETTSYKVKLAGFDIINPVALKGTYPLIEYVVAHINNENKYLLIPLFKLMDDALAAKKTLEYINSHSSSLTALFGEEEFRLFKFCLENQLMAEEMLFSNEFEIARKRYYMNLRRDYHMWLNFTEILDVYGSNTDKIVLMGHNAHLNKSRNNDQTAYNRSLGYYLSQYLGENYQAIALTVGKGERIAMSKGLIYEEVLPNAVNNSIEKVAVKINVSSFFYPSSKLDSSVLFIRDMPIHSYKKNFIQSKIFDKRLDGFIYIDKSIPSSGRIKMSTYPKDSLYAQIDRYQKSNRVRIDSIIKEYEVKSK